MNPNFEITGTGLLTGVGIGVVLLMVLIGVIRAYFRRKSNSDLAEQYRDKKWDSPLEARNKYPDVDVFRYGATFWRLSLAVVLLLLIGAFNWTQYEKEVYIPDDALSMDFDVEIDVPRSATPPPPPPPPPPPSIEAVPDLELIEEEDVEFVDQSVDANTYIEAPVYHESKKEAAPPPPPPPPPPPEPEVEEIFKIVEEMPRFPGCEDLTASMEEKRQCANKKLLEFIYENIRYPAVARDNGIEGTVVVSFVVDQKGFVKDAQVVRDIGGGCGQEALRIVELMNSMPNRWTPGKQRGRAVKVLFNLPVKFKLEYN
ncbi:MAG: TonB family protein [Phaeodactylibacter sp.]|nr:TonB family protein [Phaeodactylibacter sp.]